MVEKDKYLVVVSVRQGKNFPKRPKHLLIVEAKFEGELLMTDPVEHNEIPDITQELAWELDKKTLHQHRMQRTSVKVQVYSQDMSSSVREAVGYVVLDLRSAQSHPVMKSYPLLHTKYRRSRPEIELSLYIDEGKGEELVGERARPNRTPEHARQQMTTIDPKLLKPVLIGTDGFYQIGPVEAGSDRFILSTTVAFASNLVQLVPTNVALPSTGYFFFYSLLGNDVTTEVFHDLLSPSFPAERASVRLSGHLDLVRQFFASQPGLELHLCCGDQSLGSCEIPLGGLLKKGSTEIYMRPVSVEGAFQISPPKTSKLAVSRVLPEDQRPVVGVSVVLRVDQPSTEICSSPGKEAPVVTQPTTTAPAVIGNPPPVAKASNKNTAAAKRPGGHDGSYVETLDSRSREDEKSDGARDRHKEQQQEPVAKGVDHESKRKGEAGGMGDAANPPYAASSGVVYSNDFDPPDIDSRATGDDVSSDTQHHIAVPSALHHFRVSIDLRSIANLSVTHPTLVFLKYTYVFFGSSSPVLTEPSVEVRRATEVTLPKSYCAFDFATTRQQLQDTFTRVPLAVEVWKRDHQMSQNSVLGVAHVALSTVLKSSRSKALHSSGVSGWKQTSHDRFPVLSTDGEERRMADLEVVVTLEDWGPTVPQTIVVNAQSSRSDNEVVSNTPPVGPVGVAAQQRETLEYKAAMELELWKAQRQEEFQKELQLHLKELEQEYKRRDKERQLLIAKQKAELDKMEAKLRTTLTDLEKQEKKVATSEQKVLNEKTTLEREHKRKMMELEDASRRLKEDCDHQVALERKKIKDLEETVSKLKQRVAEEESKSQRLGRDFDSYKEKINTQPQVQLQAEVMQLRMEKMDLEKHLEKAVQSTIRYKQQLRKVLGEVNRRNKKDLKDARAKERQRMREIEHLKLHYQMRKDTEAESKELGQIKKEMHELERSRSLASQPPQQQFHQLDDEEDEHLVRLIAERDLLLKTGTYTMSDSIIANLEREIRDITKRKGEKTRGSLYSERTGPHSMY